MSDNQKKKIAIIFGTRPEFIKLAPVIRAIESSSLLESVVINSSQHTDLLDPFVRTFGIKVDHDLQVMRESQSPSQVLSRLLPMVEAVLQKEKPDVVIVQGDTTTALGGALSAFHEKIPVGHVEAGLRTDDIRSPFPEEVNRRLISRIAEFHFAATEANVSNLTEENVPPDQIWLTGNPVVDSLHWILENRSPSAKIQELLEKYEDGRIVVLTTHRRENFGQVMSDNLRCIAQFAAENPDTVVVFPVHPNPNVRAATKQVLEGARGFEIIDPLDYSDFIHLLSKSWLIVSDSGGVQEEAPSLGKRLIVLRTSTERPEVVDAGIAKLIGDDPKKLGQVLRTADEDSDWLSASEGKNSLFGSGDSALKIRDVLQASLHAV